jgi:hypothetical protein
MTYVCIWEIGLGVVKAVLSARDATILSSAGTAFGLNFDDLSNAPAATYAVPVPPDGILIQLRNAPTDRVTSHISQILFGGARCDMES